MARPRDSFAGYERLPGPARRIRTPSGEIISRRQFENRRFRAIGWKNWREFQDRFDDPMYRDFLKSAGLVTGTPIRTLSRANDEFTRSYIRHRDTIRRRRAGAQSDAAQWLVKIGKRPAGATYPIGDTPPKRRRK